jgi:hypothetical protein
VRRVTKACADARHLSAITSRQSCLRERKEAKIMSLKHLPSSAGLWIPGYFVFIETGAGTYLCDATADAQVSAFAEIGDPLTFGHSVS